MELIIKKSFDEMIVALSRRITANSIPHQYHSLRGIPEATTNYEYMKALERNLTRALVYPQFQYHGGRIDAVVVAEEGVIAFEGKGTLRDSVMASMDHEIMRLDHWWVREAITSRLSAPERFPLWAVTVADTFEKPPGAAVDWLNEWWINFDQRPNDKEPIFLGVRSLIRSAQQNPNYKVRPWWHLLGYKRITTVPQIE